MTSRRQMLKSSLALAAGAVGFGAARKAMEGADPVVKASPDGKPPRSLEIQGRNVHALVEGRPLGHGPAAGGRTALSGELIDASGAFLGRFLGTSIAFDPDEAGAAAMESHTFQLDDGTLHGMGTVQPETDTVFAIVGGTGRYLGARGSYVARHMPIELGGDGSAAFTMTFAK
ncbi:MAG TPA: hypothetical protein VNN79_25300 [Actinomycetota bacterium]|nr:hypothetical protein [Actinomycetota bacterium]